MTSQELIDAIRGAGYAPRPYIWRGLRRECVAVNISGHGSFWRLAYEMGRLHGETTFPDPALDSMGTGFVAYWPEYAWPEASQELTASDLIAEPDDLGAPYNAV